MRRRIKDFTIDTATNQISLTNDNITIDDIRLIIDETQNIVICSSMQKSNITVSDNKIAVDTSICQLNNNDHITLEIDTADSIEDIRGVYYTDTDKKKNNSGNSKNYARCYGHRENSRG